MPGFGQNFQAAATSLREQWQRALLCALGIMVGTVAILLLVSIAKGVQQDITGQIEDIGVNVLVVIPGRIESGSFNPNLGGASYLKEEDAVRLRSVPGVVTTAAWTFVGGGVRNGNKVANSILVATTPEWFRMHTLKMQEGRKLTEEDRRRDVVMIGSVAKEELFGKGPALGKRVTVNGRRYEVVGVTQDKKSEQSLFSIGGMQNLVYLPYDQLKAREPAMQTDRIMIQIEPSAEPKTLIKRLDGVLEERLDRQQFQVLTQEDLLGLVYKLMGILTWLLTGLTSIALFVGGVGIMAVMLMSANERTQEIGIRKTVGARRGDIFQQFLAESTLLGFFGGLLGLVFSYAVCLGLYCYTPIKPMVTFSTVLLAFGVSMGIGSVFGLIPAMHAAKKDPVEALRTG